MVTMETQKHTMDVLFNTIEIKTKSCKLIKNYSNDRYQL